MKITINYATNSKGLKKTYMYYARHYPSSLYKCLSIFLHLISIWILIYTYKDAINRINFHHEFNYIPFSWSTNLFLPIFRNLIMIVFCYVCYYYLFHLKNYYLGRLTNHPNSVYNILANLSITFQETSITVTRIDNKELVKVFSYADYKYYFSKKGILLKPISGTNSSAIHYIPSLYLTTTEYVQLKRWLLDNGTSLKNN